MVEAESVRSMYCTIDRASGAERRPYGERRNSSRRCPPGAGRKRKALADKIMEGKALPPVTPLEGVDMPDIKEYLTESQHTGELHADEVYRETWEWLSKNGCAQYVSQAQLEEYPVSRMLDGDNFRA